MKNPFNIVCGLGLFKHDKRHRQAIELSSAQLEELAQASQDMQEMRDCYDSLLSAAAGTMNTTHAFSQSLLELGDCLLQKSALSDDEDSERVLLMLGKAQFKIQELIRNYHSQLNETITAPSKSLLNRLRIVEDMKIQCDEKRSTYEALKNSKGHVSSQELQSARDEFNENATLFIFCMKSLKRGQSRSLLTQATRHYAAQMRFFRKAFKTLESIEPHVKLTTELHHIDYCHIMRDKYEDIFLTDRLDHDESQPMYVLPTPPEKNSVTSGIESQPRPQTNNMWHSTPIKQKIYAFSGLIGSTSHGPHIPKLTRAFSTPQQASYSLTVTGFPRVCELHQLPRPPATKKASKLGFSMTFKHGPNFRNTVTNRP